MIDPMAGLIAAGAAKSATTEALSAGAEVLDSGADLSAPKRAILTAAGEVLGLITGNTARLPWGMRAMVEVMTRQVQGGMLAAAVAAMDEEEVRRLVTEVRDRAAAALDG